ncbi:hypothetical protein ACIBFB_25915 [Nocardiopsis sp. NPDC050513]|uniref:hypothetical protein n=1 Tax=Nocardiopsis sp. NPDC050513 TaxID=3364338 RepID=UPI00378C98C7
MTYDDPGASRDPVPERWDMLPFPCHHGCNCGLHELTVYGSLVNAHHPDALDNGEMAALVEAGERASIMLHESRDRFVAGPVETQRARSRASRAVARLERHCEGGELIRAARRLSALESDYAHYNQADRAPTGRPLRILTAAVLGILVVFDAWYFQSLFSRLLGLAEDDPLKWVGALVGGVIGAALYLAGYLLAGPVRDLRAHWRADRAARRVEDGAEGVPRRRWVRGLWPWLLVAFPVLAILVFAYWAMLRFAVDVGARQEEAPVEAVFLFLLMALTLMGLEIVSRNPYADRHRSLERAYQDRRGEADRLCEEAAEAVTEYEEAWRGMRALRDEGLTMARRELGRAWSRMILPARLRHGRAGWESPTLRGMASPDSFHAPNGNGAHGNPARGVNGVGGDTAPPRAAEMSAEDVERLYQFFENIRQPVPGLGPLAEVIRAIPELDPGDVRVRFDRVEQRMNWQYHRDPAPEEPT